MARLFIFCYHKMNQERVTISTRIKEISLSYLSNQIGLIWKNVDYTRRPAFAGRWQYVKSNIFLMFLLDSNILVSIHSYNTLNYYNIPFIPQYRFAASYRELILPRVSLFPFWLPNWLPLRVKEYGGMKNRKIKHL